MKNLKTVLLIQIIVVSALQTFAQFSGEAKNASEWSIKAANTIMSKKSGSYGAWDYVVGTVLRGFEEVWIKTGDSKYYDYIKSTVDASVGSDGKISGYVKSDYNIDEIAQGRAVLFLYNKTRAEKYKKAAEILYDQLQSHPRTSLGGFWHKSRYEYQMWLDGLYMGSPFYAEYGKVFNKSDAFDDVAKQVFLMEKYMRDPQTGLLYHGWDEKKIQKWADDSTGLSESFWGRGMGWYGMAILDILDFIPQNFQHRDSLIHTFQRFANAIVKYQDESGCWYQVVDQGTRSGNYLEASASCMFVYALAKGVRLGYLDNTYLDEIEKGYNGIISKFVSGSGTDIKLNKICKSAGLGQPDSRDGTFGYYVGEDIVSDDGKGLGPFLTAGIEVSRLTQPVALEKRYGHLNSMDERVSKLEFHHGQTLQAFQFKSAKEQSGLLEIHSINGKLQYRKQITCTPGVNIANFPDRNFAKGIYKVTIRFD
jgi:unsaturated rhamnogalacturonyl hydrolase